MPCPACEHWPQKDKNTVCLPAGFVMPRNRPWYVILPGSHRILWWDALVRWLAVFFFIQIPMDIAFRGQQRLARWYYISIQVTAVVVCITVTTLQMPCSTSQQINSSLISLWTSSFLSTPLQLLLEEDLHRCHSRAA